MTIIVIIVAWHGDQRSRLMACLDHRHQQQPQQQQYFKQRMIMAVVMINDKEETAGRSSPILYLDSVFEPLLLELMYAKAGSRVMLMPCSSCCSMGCV